MAIKKALVVNDAGKGFIEQAAADTLYGSVAYNAAQTLTAAQQQQARANIGASGHAVFNGTLTVPQTLGGGASNAPVTLTPATSGDALATTDNATIHFRTALPTGLNIANYIVSATNQVTVYFTSNVLIGGGGTMALTVVAHR